MKNINWTPSKLNFSTSKGTINRMKRQGMQWEKISVNYVPNKGLIFRRDTVSTTQQQQQKSPQFKKWAKDLNTHFSKEVIQMSISTKKQAQHH